MIEWLVYLALACSAVPVMMAAINWPLFRRLRKVSADRDSWPAASVLIPARNEADRVGPVLDKVLASEGITLQVIVLDDGSTDGTAELVQQYAQADSRLRLMHGAPLPSCWSGKQHACQQLADAASHDVLIWIDADVEVTPQAFARSVTALKRGPAALISGFPRQRMRSFAELCVVPMIHVLLLGYLPMPGMRWTRHPGFAAGCGQFFIADREAYEAMGGHRRIAQSFHDGITLPRAFRRAGYGTLIFDATDVAHCRMYDGLSDLWWGFVKNAHEGMATPIALPIWTTLLLGGHVLPWLLLVAGLIGGGSAAWLTWAGSSCVLIAGFTLVVGVRYRQPWRAVLYRPVGVILLLAIQWHALVRRLCKQPTAWRGRVQPTDVAST
jgi:hypothetical protein